MELNKIFASHMVFPAKKPVIFYGNGQGNVKITFAGTEKSAAFDTDNWTIEFPPMEYGGPYSAEVVFDDKTVTIEDIYIGEVFLFAGQSNMEFKMSETNMPCDSYLSNNKLRLFSTDKFDKADKFTPEDGWVVCDKKDVGSWSALAYLVSQNISVDKDIAVGAVVCYQSASVIESWVPEKTFEKININIPIENKFPDHTAENLQKWNTDGAIYSYSLSQVIPYPLSAVIWYQGESDTSVEEGKVYCDELCALIDTWRNDFHNESLMFVIVQIANTYSKMTEGWKLVQAAQKEVGSKRPFVKTVISGDVCETDNIHPKTKDKLANRIAEALKSYM